MEESIDTLQPNPTSLHDIPELKEIHVREGVTLRPLEVEDATRMLEILDTDPSIRDRVSVASRMHSPESVAEQVETYQNDAHTIRYALLEGDRPVGLVSFWRDIDNPFNAPDNPNDYGFGYFLDPNERGKGLVPDAVQQVMNTAQDVLHVENFIAYCEDNNPESITALTKLGFESTDLTYEEQNNGWVERKYVKSTQPNEPLSVIELPSEDEVTSRQQALPQVDHYEVRHGSGFREARFEAIKRLERINKQDYSVEELQELEAQAHDYTPTIGIEIEIYDKALLSEAERTLSPDEQADVIAKRKRTLGRIERTGIPRDDSDPGWWEFALQPTRTPELLTAEVQALEDADVLHGGERYYPLHVTLGGITSEKQSALSEVMEHDLQGEQVFVLVHALEASGIATTPKRLMMPATSSVKGDYWTSGNAGIIEREPEQMRGVNFTNGVEIRSFCFSTVEELGTIMQSTQALGAALSAYQDLSRLTEHKSAMPLSHKTIETRPAPRIRSGADLEDVIRLSAVWSDFSHKVHELFGEAGLVDPSTVWHEPRSKGLLRSASTGDYGAMANFMKKATKPGSPEHAVQQQLVRLIESAATAVNNITRQESTAPKV